MKHYKLFSALTNRENLALRELYNVMVRNGVRCMSKATIKKLQNDKNYFVITHERKQGRKVVYRSIVITSNNYMDTNTHYNMIGV